jgi:hypothetical protein
MISVTTRTLLAIILLAVISGSSRAQIAQPYLGSVTPIGAPRGQKVTVTIEGFNLSGATAVIFDKPGISGKILINAETARTEPGPSTDPTRRYEGDRGVRNRLQIEVTIDRNVPPGEYNLRLVTPLGTTTSSPFIVGALAETVEREENDRVEMAQMITLPTTVVGDLQKIGDRDHYRFTGRAGQDLVFEIVAAAYGSRLDAVLTLLDSRGRTIASSSASRGRRDALLAHRLADSGEYTLQLTDYEQRGMGKINEFSYRLNIGELPIITDWFPLGLRQGATTTLSLRGHNLGAAPAQVTAPIVESWSPAHQFRLDQPTAPHLASNTIRLALGSTPEIVETSAAKSPTSPQPVEWPVTINGRIDGDSSEDWYRFRARRGETLLLEVAAQRYGSPLDSVIEIFDRAGRPVPRALLRCVLETSQTLNDRDSNSRGIRLLSWNGIQPEDHILIGNELLQVDILPKGPDEDVFFKSFNGQRIGFLDTTPEAHAVNTAIYKVSIHPPATILPPNGMPQIRLFYRNDDGGPMYGKDSRLTFTAPEAGDYLVRVRDVRGLQGENYAYRLAIRESQPDFSLTIDPENPNIIAGTATPVHVTAFRAEGLTGDIEVELKNLPPGFTATSGVIREGTSMVTLLLRAASNVSPLTSFPLRVEAVTVVNGRRVVRQPRNRSELAIVTVTAPQEPLPELLVSTGESQVTLEPGGRAWVSISIKRERGFKGRIPFDIRNLPHGVIVRDVGLNGVMITEDETTQRFELSAEAWTRPVEQPIVVVGRIETASPQRSEFPAAPFTLVIKDVTSPKTAKGN